MMMVNDNDIIAIIILGIVVLCITTFCYRKIFYYDERRGDLDVEIIVETDVNLTDCQNQIVDVEANNIENAEIGINDTPSQKEKKRNIVDWFKYKMYNTKDYDPSSDNIAVAHEYAANGSGLATARSIRLMETYVPASASSRRSSNAIQNISNIPSASSSQLARDETPHNVPRRDDGDYLIETERNTEEFNSEISRLASINEALRIALAATNTDVVSQNLSTSQNVDPTSPTVHQNEIENSNQNQIKNDNQNQNFSTNNTNNINNEENNKNNGNLNQNVTSPPDSGISSSHNIFLNERRNATDVIPAATCARTNNTTNI